MATMEQKENTSARRISVVIPVYRSEVCLEPLTDQLREAFAESQRPYEVILVNDGSPDGSWLKIREIAARDPRFRGINLRRNFGQDNAIMAGLKEAGGQIVVIMDDDLQHDPRDAEALIRQVEEGFDVCYARFHRKNQAWWKNAGSWLNDRLANIVVGKPKGVYLSPFKALAGDVVRELVQYDGPFPYVDGLLFRVTRHVTQVTIEHHARHAGEGNFTLSRSVSVWLRVATLSSLVPLRLATVLGFSFAAIGLLLALFFFIKKFFSPDDPMGFAAIIVAVLVLGGVQLACLGIMDEYLGECFCT